MTVKEHLARTVAAMEERLHAMSHRIHGTPELAFEEERASAWLCDELDAAGMAVERGVCDLPTAFVARAGSGPLHIAICAEYDALPGIGHACGHNVIAAAALGAGMALAQVADDLGLTVSVLGTPGEEAGDGGGKILMLERGAFAGVDAAMMVHPTATASLTPGLLAMSTFDVEYTGRPAHASTSPHLGINAADALTVAQVSVGLLRQHLPPGAKVHGVTLEAGDAPNIVPASARARYQIRSSDLEQLEEVKRRVEACFEAGATATGAEHRLHGGTRPYANVVHDSRMAAFFGENAAALGRAFPAQTLGPASAASTDMGNVSQVIPSIHPHLSLDCFPVVNHQAAFTDVARSPKADEVVTFGATSMAWTAVDIAESGDFVRSSTPN